MFFFSFFLFQFCKNVRKWYNWWDRELRNLQKRITETNAASRIMPEPKIGEPDYFRCLNGEWIFKYLFRQMKRKGKEMEYPNEERTHQRISHHYSLSGWQAIPLSWWRVCYSARLPKISCCFILSIFLSINVNIELNLIFAKIDFERIQRNLQKKQRMNKMLLFAKIDYERIQKKCIKNATSYLSSSLFVLSIFFLFILFGKQKTWKTRTSKNSLYFFLSTWFWPCHQVG